MYRWNTLCCGITWSIHGLPHSPSGRHAVFDLVELVRDGESTLYEETGWRLELEQPYKMTHTGKRVVYL